MNRWAQERLAEALALVLQLQRQVERQRETILQLEELLELEREDAARRVARVRKEVLKGVVRSSVDTGTPEPEEAP